MEPVNFHGYSFPAIGQVNNDTFVWMHGLTLQKWNTTGTVMKRAKIDLQEALVSTNTTTLKPSSTVVTARYDPDSLGWHKRPLDPTPSTGGYVQLACYGGFKFHVNPGDIPGTRDQALRTNAALARHSRFMMETSSRKWFMKAYQNWATKLMWSPAETQWADKWSTSSDWNNN